MRRASFTVLVTVAMAFAGLGVALAQVNTAELQAYVVDEGGLALPGVTATVTQTGTGAARVLACATHAVLSGEALEKIESSPLENLLVSNTIAPEHRRPCVGRRHSTAVVQRADVGVI